MIEIARIVIVFGALRAFFDAGAALDADAGYLRDIAWVDGANRTDCSAETALITGIARQRFDLADVDKDAIAVARL